MDEMKAKFVISKLLDELNAHLREGEEFLVIYDDEVDEINQALDDLNVGMILGTILDEEEDE